MATGTVLKTATPLFPAQAIGDCLRDELTSAVTGVLKRKGAPVPPGPLSGLPFFVDSLCAVEALCVLDDLLPFTVDESAVRAGGYDSIDAAVNDIVARVQSKWNDHYLGGKK